METTIRYIALSVAVLCSLLCVAQFRHLQEMREDDYLLDRLDLADPSYSVADDWSGPADTLTQRDDAPGAPPQGFASNLVPVLLHGLGLDSAHGGGAAQGLFGPTTQAASGGVAGIDPQQQQQQQQQQHQEEEEEGAARERQQQGLAQLFTGSIHQALEGKVSLLLATDSHQQPQHQPQPTPQRRAQQLDGVKQPSQLFAALQQAPGNPQQQQQQQPGEQSAPGKGGPLFAAGGGGQLAPGGQQQQQQGQGQGQGQQRQLPPALKLSTNQDPHAVWTSGDGVGFEVVEEQAGMQRQSWLNSHPRPRQGLAAVGVGERALGGPLTLPAGVARRLLRV